MRSSRSDGPLLLDTHIWLWHLGGDKRLPTSLRDAITRAGAGAWLSPISIWEAGLLVERGRLQLHIAYRAWIEEAKRQLPLREATTTDEVAVTAHEISLPHGDPADRLLAATALVYELTLVTVDRLLVGVRWLPTRSR